MEPNFTFRRAEATKTFPESQNKFDDHRLSQMTDTNQKQLGNTLWTTADQLRGAMDAEDFREPSSMP